MPSVPYRHATLDVRFTVHFSLPLKAPKDDRFVFVFIMLPVASLPVHPQ